jgi:hypothetical protein
MFLEMPYHGRAVALKTTYIESKLKPKSVNWDKLLSEVVTTYASVIASLVVPMEERETV